MLTIKNIRHIYLSGIPVTYFEIYEFRNGTWILDYSDKVEGNLKTKLGIAKKHCKENDRIFNKDNWEF